MDLVYDPPTDVKIRKMRERVRWQDPLIRERNIDQTRMVLDDGHADSPDFSFMVIGDSGSGPHRGYNPQRQIAERMLEHRQGCRFVLHTGDVIYLVGSSEYYPRNFIEPYREFLVGGEYPQKIAYNKLLFSLPILTVPGNHDYYDLSPMYGLLAQLTLPLRRLLSSKLDLDIGWHGSYQGMAYAQAFLDYLKDIPDGEPFLRHLDQHYSAQIDTGRCLRYEVGRFTRLPNRYYTFRYGGIDFFALDSTTFNNPSPIPMRGEGSSYRLQLQQRRSALEQEKQDIMQTAASLDGNKPEEAEQINDLRAKLEQLDELELDIDKQLATDEIPVVDWEQLDWLKQRLIESWHTAGVRGRILYFHHPPYVTEATKWHQGQTLAVRDRLRHVLDQVSKTVGSLADGRSIVDLVLNGHAHCLEYLRTLDTDHADAHTNWIVCGGSGYSLRRQRQEGSELTEYREKEGDRPVARSLLFIGRSGQGSLKHRPYSCLRIDVKDGIPPKFVIRPIVSDRYQHHWINSEPDSFII